MPRRLSWGTPGGRSARYYQPRSPYLRVLLGFGLASAAFGLFLILEFGGRFVLPLRIPLMPGGLIARHGAETNHRCEACHAGPRVTNVRCQRCHDEAGPGRMTHAAHAGRHEELQRKGDARAVASVAPLQCVRCHVEHRGSQEGAVVRLVEVNDGQCVSCHGSRRVGADGPRPVVSKLSSHPEFAIKASKGAEPVLVGAYFSHKKHFVAARKALQKGQPAAPSDEAVCRSCHVLASGQPGRREFAPVDAGVHCFSCHDHDEDLKTGAIPALAAAGGASGDPCQAGGDQARGFDCSGGQVRKLAVVHKDPWIRGRVDLLRRQLYPEAHERERADLLARQYRLARRLFLGQMLATLEASELEGRAADVSAELARFAERAKAEAGDPAAAERRVEEVLAALLASGAKDATLSLQLQGVKGKGAPQPALDYEARRAELLELLDALTAAEPELRARAQELRLRLVLASPGDDAGSADRRAAGQRRDDLQRLRDELGLRKSGLPQRGPTQRAAEDLARAGAALQRTRARLGELAAVDAERAAAPWERERKEQLLQALVGKAHDSGCAHCHVIEEASFLPVKMAQPILTLADFRHEPHLGAAKPRSGLIARLFGRGGKEQPSGTCESCHTGMKESQEAQDLHLEGIASCKECHGAGLSDRCQLCHRYHPQARP
jgi:hypothetical protein